MRKILLVLLLISTASFGVETLDTVESNVYEMPGTQQEIALKGKTCVAQLITSDTAGSPITDANIDGGIIVGRSILSYSSGMLKNQLRSTVTFLSKDGKFKIKQTGIDQFVGGNRSPTPVYKQWGSGWAGTQKVLEKLNVTIANCVLKSNSENENW